MQLKCYEFFVEPHRFAQGAGENQPGWQWQRHGFRMLCVARIPGLTWGVSTGRTGRKVGKCKL